VKCIFLSAGEPSGDLHGAAVASALRARWPDVRLRGLGGPRMAAAGVELMAHVDDLAVMGFVEVAAHLPFFLDLMRRVKHSLAADPPDLVLPIDYPGFNLRLARFAKSRNIPVLYYIAPQVWAWHRSRLAEMARITDHVAVILPFEAALFREAGAQVTFVGHPLLDRAAPKQTREAIAAELSLDPDRPIVALFPGSRRQEVARHGRLFADVAEIMRRTRPDVQAVVAVSSAVPATAYDTGDLPRTADGWSLLGSAHAALVKSGTGTLEAALAGTPLVVAYRAHPLTFQLAKRLVKVDHVGLVNLVAGERLAPEYLQGDARPGPLATAVLALLEPGSERTRALDGMARVRERLHAPNDNGSAAERVASIAASLVGRDA
jgi:lipid-A-disaccharide synthase